MPWLSSGEYRRLLRALARAESRADRSEASLTSERAAYLIDVRHLVSMFLRSRGSYPLPTARSEPQPVAENAVSPAVEPIDAGEYEALLEAAGQYGVSRAQVDELLARERGELI
jgi:hypothetical protein